VLEQMRQVAAEGMTTAVMTYEVGVAREVGDTSVFMERLGTAAVRF
jgi:ABC-type polar amino acid transport system ATPase subunit